MTGTKCRGYCQQSFWGWKAKFVKDSRYKVGQKFCSTCQIYIKSNDQNLKNCPCCNCKLRTKSPYSQKRIKSDEGKNFLGIYNITIKRIRHEIALLPHYIRHNKHGEATRNIIQSLPEYITLAEDCLDKIALLKYEKKERIENKRQNILEQKEIIEKLLANL